MLTLTLNRPDALNAFTVEMKEALLAALKDAARDKEVRVVVLTGAGRAFTAGQDLKERQGPDVDDLGTRAAHPLQPDHPRDATAGEADHRRDQRRRGRRGHLESRWPATSSSRRTRRPSSRRSAASASCRTPARPGSCRASLVHQRAAEMMFTADPVDAATAERIGLINRVVPADTPDGRGHRPRHAAGQVRAHRPGTGQARPQPRARVWTSRKRSSSRRSCSRSPAARSRPQGRRRGLRREAPGQVQG